MKRRNPAAEAVRTPRYRLRVVKSKKLYARKPKHRGGQAEHRRAPVAVNHPHTNKSV